MTTTQTNSGLPTMSLADKLAALKAKASLVAGNRVDSNIAIPVVENPTNRQPMAQVVQVAQVAQATSSNQNATILLNLAYLENALLEGDPNIAGNLRLIHRALLDDPSQVTLLNDEQRTTYFKGLMKQTGVVITAAATKSSSRKKLDVANMTADDFM